MKKENSLLVHQKQIQVIEKFIYVIRFIKFYITLNQIKKNIKNIMIVNIIIII